MSRLQEKHIHSVTAAATATIAAALHESPTAAKRAPVEDQRDQHAALPWREADEKELARLSRDEVRHSL